MVAGIGRTRLLLAAGLVGAFAAGVGDAGHNVLEPQRTDAPPPSPREQHRLAAEQERRAADRRERKRREAEDREQRLRQRIAEGRDDRDDKYLHASARRRRAAENAAPATPETTR